MTAIIRCIVHDWFRAPNGLWFCKACGEPGIVIGPRERARFLARTLRDAAHRGAT